jgi:hypothetical protein
MHAKTTHKKDKWWAYLLLVAFLTPLDVTSHAGFVLNGHSFPSTIHVVASISKCLSQRPFDETACEVDPAVPLGSAWQCPLPATVSQVWFSNYFRCVFTAQNKM